MRRILLVGCPRSGTTVLQAMVARHRHIFTIPESHYFQAIKGRLGDRLPGLVSPRAAARTLNSLVEATGPTTVRPDIPRWWLGSSRYARCFPTVLDAAASRQGAKAWVEKSPIHLHHLDVIAAAVPEVRFIHLIRDGRDVTASLVEQAERDPELWVPQLLGRRSSAHSRRDIIDAAIRRWNEDVGLSLARSNSVNHLLVFFDDLLDDTQGTLETLCGFIGLDFDGSMLRHTEDVERVLGRRADLPHMQRTHNPLEDRRLEGFKTVFDPEERDFVASRLSFGGRAKTESQRSHSLPPEP